MESGRHNGSPYSLGAFILYHAFGNGLSFIQELTVIDSAGQNILQEMRKFRTLGNRYAANINCHSSVARTGGMLIMYGGGSCMDSILPSLCLGTNDDRAAKR